MKIILKSKLGFTLIELLVVIGILAVLAAIAIPSVAGLIDRANVSADNTNANGMTNAMERFVSEYELYCQDIASNNIDFDNLNATQNRVFNVTGVTEWKHIVAIESETGLGDKKIDKDTKYPITFETISSVVTNYTKTPSTTFKPKQSDCHYYYSPQIGVVVCAEISKSSNAELNALIQSGKDAKGNELREDNVTWIDITVNNNIGIDHNSNIVSKGAKYVSVDGVTYTEGMELPTLKRGDKYYYKEYIYTYYPSDGTEFPAKGWHVRVHANYKSNDIVSNPLTYIRNVPILKMHQTYLNMENLKIAPQMPETVTIMTQTFQGCISLEYSPDIPNSVTVMQQTFYDCKSLKTPPKISKNVEDMFVCFGRSGIESLPDLSKCNNLLTLYSAFFRCSNLTDASNFIIPNSVSNLSSFLWNCANLETAPIIPCNVTNIDSAFGNCPKLSGTLIVNSTVIENYNGAIKGSKIEKVEGSTTEELKNAIFATK